MESPETALQKTRRYFGPPGESLTDNELLKSFIGTFGYVPGFKSNEDPIDLEDATTLTKAYENLEAWSDSALQVRKDETLLPTTRNWASSKGPWSDGFSDEALILDWVKHRINEGETDYIEYMVDPSRAYELVPTIESYYEPRIGSLTAERFSVGGDGAGYDPVFERAFETVLKYEPDTAVPRGDVLARFGVDPVSFPDLTQEQVLQLKPQEAQKHVYDRYWNEAGIGGLPIGIAEKTMDLAIEFSPSTASKMLRQTLQELGVEVEGSETGAMFDRPLIDAAGKADAMTVAQSLAKKQRDKYNELYYYEPTKYDDLLDKWYQRAAEIPAILIQKAGEKLANQGFPRTADEIKDAYEALGIPGPQARTIADRIQQLRDTGELGVSADNLNEFVESLAGSPMPGDGMTMGEARQYAAATTTGFGVFARSMGSSIFQTGIGEVAKGLGIIQDKIDDALGAIFSEEDWTGDDTEVDYALYRFGEWFNKNVDELFGLTDRDKQRLAAKFGSGFGSMIGFMLSGAIPGAAAGRIGVAGKTAAQLATRVSKTRWWSTAVAGSIVNTPDMMDRVRRAQKDGKLKLTPAQAEWIAIGVGVGVGFTEAINIARAFERMKWIRPKDAARLEGILQGSFRQKAKAVAGHATAGATEESLQEGWNALGNSLGEMAFAEDWEWEKMIDDMKEQAMIGGTTGGTLEAILSAAGLAAAGRHYRRAMRKAGNLEDRSERDGTDMPQLDITAAEESPALIIGVLQQRSGELERAAKDTATPDKPVDTDLIQREMAQIDGALSYYSELHAFQSTLDKVGDELSEADRKDLNQRIEEIKGSPEYELGQKYLHDWLLPPDQRQAPFFSAEGPVEAGEAKTPAPQSPPAVSDTPPETRPATPAATPTVTPSETPSGEVPIDQVKTEIYTETPKVPVAPATNVPRKAKKKGYAIIRSSPRAWSVGKVVGYGGTDDRGRHTVTVDGVGNIPVNQITFEDEIGAQKRADDWLAAIQREKAGEEAARKPAPELTPLDEMILQRAVVDQPISALRTLVARFRDTGDTNKADYLEQLLESRIEAMRKMEQETVEDATIISETIREPELEQEAPAEAPPAEVAEEGQPEQAQKAGEPAQGEQAIPAQPEAPAEAGELPSIELSEEEIRQQGDTAYDRLMAAEADTQPDRRFKQLRYGTQQTMFEEGLPSWNESAFGEVLLWPISAREGIGYPHPHAAYDETIRYVADVTEQDYQDGRLTKRVPGVPFVKTAAGQWMRREDAEQTGEELAPEEEGPTGEGEPTAEEEVPEITPPTQQEEPQPPTLEPYTKLVMVASDVTDEMLEMAGYPKKVMQALRSDPVKMDQAKENVANGGVYARGEEVGDPSVLLNFVKDERAEVELMVRQSDEGIEIKQADATKLLQKGEDDDAKTLQGEVKDLLADRGKTGQLLRQLDRQIDFLTHQIGRYNRNNVAGANVIDQKTLNGIREYIRTRRWTPAWTFERAYELAMENADALPVEVRQLWVEEYQRREAERIRSQEATGVRVPADVAKVVTTFGGRDVVFEATPNTTPVTRMMSEVYYPWLRTGELPDTSLEVYPSVAVTMDAGDLIFRPQPMTADTGISLIVADDGQAYVVPTPGTTSEAQQMVWKEFTGSDVQRKGMRPLQVFANPIDETTIEWFVASHDAVDGDSILAQIKRDFLPRGFPTVTQAVANLSRAKQLVAEQNAGIRTLRKAIEERATEPDKPEDSTLFGARSVQDLQRDLQRANEALRRAEAEVYNAQLIGVVASNVAIAEDASQPTLVRLQALHMVYDTMSTLSRVPETVSLYEGMAEQVAAEIERLQAEDVQVEPEEVEEEAEEIDEGPVLPFKAAGGRYRGLEDWMLDIMEGRGDIDTGSLAMYEIHQAEVIAREHGINQGPIVQAEGRFSNLVGDLENEVVELTERIADMESRGEEVSDQLREELEIVTQQRDMYQAEEQDTLNSVLADLGLPSEVLIVLDSPSDWIYESPRDIRLAQKAIDALNNLPQGSAIHPEVARIAIQRLRDFIANAPGDNAAAVAEIDAMSDPRPPYVPESTWHALPADHEMFRQILDPDLNLSTGIVSMYQDLLMEWSHFLPRLYRGKMQVVVDAISKGFIGDAKKSESHKSRLFLAREQNRQRRNLIEKIDAHLRRGGDATAHANTLASTIDLPDMAWQDMSIGEYREKLYRQLALSEAYHAFIEAQETRHTRYLMGLSQELPTREAEETEQMPEQAEIFELPTGEFQVRGGGTTLMPVRTEKEAKRMKQVLQRSIDVAKEAEQPEQAPSPEPAKPRPRPTKTEKPVVDRTRQLVNQEVQEADAERTAAEGMGRADLVDTILNRRFELVIEAERLAARDEGRNVRAFGAVPEEDATRYAGSRVRISSAEIPNGAYTVVRVDDGGNTVVVATLGPQNIVIHKAVPVGLVTVVRFNDDTSPNTVYDAANPQAPVIDDTEAEQVSDFETEEQARQYVFTQLNRAEEAMRFIASESVPFAQRTREYSYALQTAAALGQIPARAEKALMELSAGQYLTFVEEMASMPSITNVQDFITQVGEMTPTMITGRAKKRVKGATSPVVPAADSGVIEEAVNLFGEYQPQTRGTDLAELQKRYKKTADKAAESKRVLEAGQMEGEQRTKEQKKRRRLDKQALELHQQLLLAGFERMIDNTNLHPFIRLAAKSRALHLRTQGATDQQYDDLRRMQRKVDAELHAAKIRFAGQSEYASQIASAFDMVFGFGENPDAPAEVQALNFEKGLIVASGLTQALDGHRAEVQELEQTIEDAIEELGPHYAFLRDMALSIDTIMRASTANSVVNMGDRQIPEAIDQIVADNITATRRFVDEQIANFRTAPPTYFARIPMQAMRSEYTEQYVSDDGVVSAVQTQAFDAASVVDAMRASGSISEQQAEAMRATLGGKTYTIVSRGSGSTRGEANRSARSAVYLVNGLPPTAKQLMADPALLAQRAVAVEEDMPYVMAKQLVMWRVEMNLRNALEAGDFIPTERVEVDIDGALNTIQAQIEGETAEEALASLLAKQESLQTKLEAYNEQLPKLEQQLAKAKRVLERYLGAVEREKIAALRAQLKEGESELAMLQAKEFSLFEEADEWRTSVAATPEMEKILKRNAKIEEAIHDQETKLRLRQAYDPRKLEQLKNEIAAHESGIRNLKARASRVTNEIYNLESQKQDVAWVSALAGRTLAGSQSNRLFRLVALDHLLRLSADPKSRVNLAGLPPDLPSQVERALRQEILAALGSLPNPEDAVATVRDNIRLVTGSSGNEALAQVTNVKEALDLARAYSQAREVVTESYVDKRQQWEQRFADHSDASLEEFAQAGGSLDIDWTSVKQAARGLMRRGTDAMANAMVISANQQVNRIGIQVDEYFDNLNDRLQQREAEEFRRHVGQERNLERMKSMGVVVPDISELEQLRGEYESVLGSDPLTARTDGETADGYRLRVWGTLQNAAAHVPAHSSAARSTELGLAAAPDKIPVPIAEGHLYEQMTFTPIGYGPITATTWSNGFARVFGPKAVVTTLIADAEGVPLQTEPVTVTDTNWPSDKEAPGYAAWPQAYMVAVDEVAPEKSRSILLFSDGHNQVAVDASTYHGLKRKLGGNLSVHITTGKVAILKSGDEWIGWMNDEFGQLQERYSDSAIPSLRLYRPAFDVFTAESTLETVDERKVAVEEQVQRLITEANSAIVARRYGDAQQLLTEAMQIRMAAVGDTHRLNDIPGLSILTSPDNAAVAEEAFVRQLGAVPQGHLVRDDVEDVDLVSDEIGDAEFEELLDFFAYGEGTDELSGEYAEEAAAVETMDERLDRINRQLESLETKWTAAELVAAYNQAIEIKDAQQNTLGYQLWEVLGGAVNERSPSYKRIPQGDIEDPTGLQKLRWLADRRGSEVGMISIDELAADMQRATGDAEWTEARIRELINDNPSRKNPAYEAQKTARAVASAYRRIVGKPITEHKKYADQPMVYQAGSIERGFATFYLESVQVDPNWVMLEVKSVGWDQSYGDTAAVRSERERKQRAMARRGRVTERDIIVEAKQPAMDLPFRTVRQTTLLTMPADRVKSAETHPMAQLVVYGEAQWSRGDLLQSVPKDQRVWSVRMPAGNRYKAQHIAGHLTHSEAMRYAKNLIMREVATADDVEAYMGGQYVDNGPSGQGLITPTRTLPSVVYSQEDLEYVYATRMQAAGREIRPSEEESAAVYTERVTRFMEQENVIWHPSSRLPDAIRRTVNANHFEDYSNAPLGVVVGDKLGRADQASTETADFFAFRRGAITLWSRDEQSRIAKAVANVRRQRAQARRPDKPGDNAAKKFNNEQRRRGDLEKALEANAATQDRFDIGLVVRTIEQLDAARGDRLRRQATMYYEPKEQLSEIYTDTRDNQYAVRLSAMNAARDLVGPVEVSIVDDPLMPGTSETSKLLVLRDTAGNVVGTARATVVDRMSNEASKWRGIPPRGLDPKHITKPIAWQNYAAIDGVEYRRLVTEREVDRLLAELGMSETEVTVVDAAELERIAGAPAKGTGFGLYDPRTNRVYVAYDTGLVSTDGVVDGPKLRGILLHEIVGHKGIYNMLPRPLRLELFDSIWGHFDNAGHESNKYWSDALVYAGIDPRRANEAADGDRHRAVAEYLAIHAQNLDWTKLTRREKSLWSKIVAKIRSWVSKLINRDAPITDREIRGLLVAGADFMRSRPEEREQIKMQMLVDYGYTDAEKKQLADNMYPPLEDETGLYFYLGPNALTWNEIDSDPVILPGLGKVRKQVYRGAQVSVPMSMLAGGTKVDISKVPLGYWSTDEAGRLPMPFSFELDSRSRRYYNFPPVKVRDIVRRGGMSAVSQRVWEDLVAAYPMLGTLEIALVIHGHDSGTQGSWTIGRSYPVPKTPSIAQTKAKAGKITLYATVKDWGQWEALQRGQTSEVFFGTQDANGIGLDSDVSVLYPNVLDHELQHAIQYADDPRGYWDNKHAGYDRETNALAGAMAEDTLSIPMYAELYHSIFGPTPTHAEFYQILLQSAGVEPSRVFDYDLYDKYIDEKKRMRDHMGNLTHQSRPSSLVKHLLYLSDWAEVEARDVEISARKWLSQQPKQSLDSTEDFLPYQLGWIDMLERMASRGVLLQQTPGSKLASYMLNDSLAITKRGTGIQPLFITGTQYGETHTYGSVVRSVKPLYGLASLLDYTTGRKRPTWHEFGEPHTLPAELIGTKWNADPESVYSGRYDPVEMAAQINSMYLEAVSKQSLPDGPGQITFALEGAPLNHQFLYLLEQVDNYAVMYEMAKKIGLQPRGPAYTSSIDYEGVRGSIQYRIANARSVTWGQAERILDSIERRIKDVIKSPDSYGGGTAVIIDLPADIRPVARIDVYGNQTDEYFNQVRDWISTIISMDWVRGVNANAGRFDDYGPIDYESGLDFALRTDIQFEDHAEVHTSRYNQLYEMQHSITNSKQQGIIEINQWGDGTEAEDLPLFATTELFESPEEAEPADPNIVPAKLYVRAWNAIYDVVSETEDSWIARPTEGYAKKRGVPTLEVQKMSRAVESVKVGSSQVIVERIDDFANWKRQKDNPHGTADEARRRGHKLYPITWRNDWDTRDKNKPLAYISQQMPDGKRYKIAQTRDWLSGRGKVWTVYVSNAIPQKRYARRIWSRMDVQFDSADEAKQNFYVTEAQILKPIVRKAENALVTGMAKAANPDERAEQFIKDLDNQALDAIPQLGEATQAQVYGALKAAMPYMLMRAKARKLATTYNRLADNGEARRKRRMQDTPEAQEAIDTTLEGLYGLFGESDDRVFQEYYQGVEWLLSTRWEEGVYETLDDLIEAANRDLNAVAISRYDPGFENYLYLRFGPDEADVYRSQFDTGDMGNLGESDLDLEQLENGWEDLGDDTYQKSVNGHDVKIRLDFGDTMTWSYNIDETGYIGRYQDVKSTQRAVYQAINRRIAAEALPADMEAGVSVRLGNIGRQLEQAGASKQDALAIVEHFETIINNAAPSQVESLLRSFERKTRDHLIPDFRALAAHAAIVDAAQRELDLFAEPAPAGAVDQAPQPRAQEATRAEQQAEAAEQPVEEQQAQPVEAETEAAEQAAEEAQEKVPAQELREVDIEGTKYPVKVYTNDEGQVSRVETELANAKGELADYAVVAGANGPIVLRKNRNDKWQTLVRNASPNSVYMTARAVFSAATGQASGRGTATSAKQNVATKVQKEEDPKRRSKRQASAKQIVDEETDKAAERSNKDKTEAPTHLERLIAKLQEQQDVRLVDGRKVILLSDTKGHMGRDATGLYTTPKGRGVIADAVHNALFNSEPVLIVGLETELTAPLGDTDRKSALRHVAVTLYDSRLAPADNQLLRPLLRPRRIKGAPSIEEARKIVQRLAKKFGVPEPQVVYDATEISQRGQEHYMMRSTKMARRGQPEFALDTERVAGVYDGQQTYIIAGNLASVNDLIDVFIEDAVLHSGFRVAFRGNSGKLNATINSIYREIMADDELAVIADDVRREYRNQLELLGSEGDRRELIVEEFLGKVAKKMLSGGTAGDLLVTDRKKGVFQRAVDRMRGLVAESQPLPNYMPSSIEALLSAAQDAAKKREKVLESRWPEVNAALRDFEVVFAGAGIRDFGLNVRSKIRALASEVETLIDEEATQVENDIDGFSKQVYQDRLKRMRVEARQIFNSLLDAVEGRFEAAKARRPAAGVSDAVAKVAEDRLVSSVRNLAWELVTDLQPRTNSRPGTSRDATPGPIRLGGLSMFSRRSNNGHSRDPITGARYKQIQRIIADFGEALNSRLYYNQARRGRRNRFPSSALRLGNLVMQNVNSPKDALAVAAHGIANQYGLLDGMPAEAREELSDLTQHKQVQKLLGMSDRASLMRSWIQFMGRWVADPNAAEALAPNVMRYLQRQMSQGRMPNGVWEAFKQYSADIRARHGSEVNDRMLDALRMIGVDNRDPKVEALIRGEDVIAGNVPLTRGNKFAYSWMNLLAPAEKAWDWIKGEVSYASLLDPRDPDNPNVVRADRDMRMMLRLVYGTNGRDDDMLVNGLLDYRNTRLTMPLRTIKMDTDGNPVIHIEPSELNKGEPDEAKRVTIERTRPIWDQSNTETVPLNIQYVLTPFLQSDENQIRLDLRDAATYMIAEALIERGARADIDVESMHAMAADIVELQQGDTSYRTLGAKNPVDVAIKYISQLESEAIADMRNNNMPPDKRMHKAIRLARIKEAARRYREFADATLQYAVMTGRLSMQQYDIIKNRNLYYVAMNRIKETEAGKEWKVFADPNAGRRTRGTEDVIYKFEGSWSTIRDPYESMISNMERIYHSSDVNRAMRTFTDILDERFWGRTFPNAPFPEAEASAIGFRTDKSAGQTIKVWVDGKETYYYIRDEWIYNSLKAWRDGWSSMTKEFPAVLRWFANLQRKMITTFPVFAGRNRMRDTMDRMVKSRNTPSVVAMIKSGFESFTMMRNSERMVENESMFMAFGGGGAGWIPEFRRRGPRLRDYASAFVNDIKENGLGLRITNLRLEAEYRGAYADLMGREIKRLAGKGHIIAGGQSWVETIGERYMRWLQGYENVNRVQEFVDARRNAKKKLQKLNQQYHEGWSADDIEYMSGLYAAFEARDLIDFSVGGIQALRWNQINPFFNASIQGIRQTIKRLGQEKRATAFIIRWLITLGIPSVLIGMMDDDEELEQMPHYQRDMFFTFRMPWLRELHPSLARTRVSIPKPFELGVTASVLERAATFFRTGDAEHFEGYLRSLAQATPFETSSIFSGALFSFAELVSNRSWFLDRPIVPYHEEDLEDYRKTLERASWSSRFLYDIMKEIGYGEMTLGDTPVFDDPRKIEYLLNETFGYWGRVVQGLPDAAGLGIDDPGNERQLEVMDIATMTGFFRYQPGYDAKDVRWVLDTANKHGYGLAPEVQALRRMGNNLFNDNVTEEQAHRVSQVMVDFAEQIRAEWENRDWETMYKIDETRKSLGIPKQTPIDPMKDLLRRDMTDERAFRQSEWDPEQEYYDSVTR